MFSDSNKDSSSAGFRISIFTQNLVFRRENFTGSGILVKPRFSDKDLAASPWTGALHTR